MRTLAEVFHEDPGELGCLASPVTPPGHWDRRQRADDRLRSRGWEPGRQGRAVLAGWHGPPPPWPPPMYSVEDGPSRPLIGPTRATLCHRCRPRPSSSCFVPSYLPVLARLPRARSSQAFDDFSEAPHRRRRFRDTPFNRRRPCYLLLTSAPSLSHFVSRFVSCLWRSDIAGRAARWDSPLRPVAGRCSFTEHSPREGYVLASGCGPQAKSSSQFANLYLRL
ncbi:hypothetical protein F4780DRAFT_667885 [Xylariomycetidae sp. FL0641]|nr:hypothetical protein F4780DRAFT_667885 [Xylariomycetidae sp. FL0641]